jgi:hypothetical protein
MTCDLAMELHARVRLGDFDAAIALATQVLERQIPRQHAEGGLWGHFRAFADHAFSEKAWIHHGGWRHDAGATFPLHLFGLIELATALPQHPHARRWRQALEDAAVGWLLPACAQNPFHLLPVGYYPGEGLVWFAGLWHGMNAAYGWIAALALDLLRLGGPAELRDVAVGNLQWIAGLNAGVTRAHEIGCRVEVLRPPEGIAEPVSMIHRVGDRTAGSWLNIPGSICNGFACGQQFRLDVPPVAALDAPSSFTDEDWITHAGGWLAGISRLQPA